MSVIRLRPRQTPYELMGLSNRSRGVNRNFCRCIALPGACIADHLIEESNFLFGESRSWWFFGRSAREHRQPEHSSAHDVEHTDGVC
jgi:hypothetical protein